MGVASMTATYFWKVLNTLFFSFVNLLSFHFKPHNKKPRPLKRSKLDIWVMNAGCYYDALCIWFHFSGNANCVTGLHAWRFGDSYFAYNRKKNLGFDEHWKIIPFSRCKKWVSGSIFREGSSFGKEKLTRVGV